MHPSSFAPAAALENLYIGLMSGTSLDGVDGVLADFSGPGVQIRAHASRPFTATLKHSLLALNTAAGDEIHRGALAANALADLYAHVVQDLLDASGTPAAAVRAVGAHGQTVRHRPGEFDGTGYSVQLNNPALLAERTGIDVVADFRSRDVAAGGQGAPLVPAFHQAVFGSADETVLVVNIGGISNLSVLGAAGGGARNCIGVGRIGGGNTGDGDRKVAGLLGFDCGPGNALLDYWCQRHTGQPFDDAGAWAATGTVIAPLLARLLDDPFFAKAPPKSTGRDLFNPQWLQRHLAHHPDAPAENVQKTLLELTVCAINTPAYSYSNNSNPTYSAKRLLVCGGGALNTHLMERLQATMPNLAVQSSGLCGLPPLQVEAAAFAWLARAALQRQPGNDPAVTGASGLRILGAIYPA